MSETLSSVISQRREELGLSQRELALAANISNSTVSRIESGEQPSPKPYILSALAKNLKLDYNYLLVITSHIDDEPEIRAIQQAAKKMTREEKKEMLTVLKIAFKKYFKDINF